jgi:UDP-N-acetylmuramoyl-L-alanyl-D-glutamate--2,6-diaminopimelate ligase
MNRQPVPYSLSEVAEFLDASAINSPVESEPVIERVTCDSRQISPSVAFVAIPGSLGDGHTFIDDAFARGAAFAVVSNEASLRGRPGIVVPDTRQALSQLAALCAGFPSESISVIGVTGTNGKSTTAWIVHNLVNGLTKRSFLLGTLGCYIGDGQRLEVPELTTPDPVSVQSALRIGWDSGCTSAALEVSSHALDQSRVDDVRFVGAVFTNLTRDHLDYHGSMEHYYSSKKKLFSLLQLNKEETCQAVVYCDDPYGRRLLAELEGMGGLRLVSYGIALDAHIRLESVESGLQGSEITFKWKRWSYTVRSPYIGIHNALNLLASLAVVAGLGLEDETWFERSLALVSELPQVPGRLERIAGDRRTVFVDYAHTPDALQHALTALRPLTSGKLWVVFGCGGDRDGGKRPQMGKMSSLYADRVVVTSDNPRTEDPGVIIRDILEAPIEPYAVITDRREAIRTVVRESLPGDVILIAGKGHEVYQIIGREKQPFSDQEEVRQALEASD